MRRRAEEETSRIAAAKVRLEEAEERARREAQLARLKAEEKARLQAEEDMRHAEEETSRLATERARREAEERARGEAQSAQIKAEEEARQRKRIAREKLEEERLRRPYEALEKESTVVAEPTIDSSALRQLIEEEESLRVLQDRLENNLDALTDSLALELEKRESEVRHHKAIMGDFSAKSARLRAAEISPETELATDQELHPWRVWDADGDPFTILIVGAGRARSTWAKGSNGFKGQRGKWREEGEATVITWDDDTVFAIEPHGSKHVLTTQPTDEITGEIRRVVSEAAPIDISEIELWEISFEDNFSGDTLDLEKWNTSFPWTQVINEELAGYSPTSVTLKDSNLTITAREEMIFYGGRTQPYTSGVITTYREFEQTYGYFELRCRISKAKGLWPAFWLFSTDHSAEIDVMDILGQKPDRVYFTLISKNAAGRPTKQNASHEGVDFSLAFHSVGVKWNPEAIVFYVDGYETASFTNNIPHKPMYLVTNLAVGGRWPGPPDGWTIFPIDFEVDFIRVFKRNEEFTASHWRPGVLSRDGQIALDQPYATTEIIGKEQIEEILSEESSRHETTLAELDEMIASLRITHRNTLAAIKTTRAQIAKTQKESNREENRLKDLQAKSDAERAERESEEDARRRSEEHAKLLAEERRQARAAAKMKAEVEERRRLAEEKERRNEAEMRAITRTQAEKEAKRRRAREEARNKAEEKARRQAGLVAIQQSREEEERRLNEEQVSKLQPLELAAEPITSVIILNVDFVRSSLNSAFWNLSYPENWVSLGHHNGYDADSFSLRNGILFIAATDNETVFQGITYAYSSGAINTFGKIESEYPSLEILCKAPLGHGLVSSIRLIGRKSGRSLVNASIAGREPDRLHFGVLTGDRERFTSSWKGSDFSLQPQKIGISISPGAIRFTVNGNEVGRILDTLPEEKLYLALSLDVGGEIAGDPTGWTPFPSYFEIDSVELSNR